MIDCRVTTRKGRYRKLRWARLLTPLKDNQQPNSLESDGPPTGWNLDHFPAVPEDKLSEINSRILENRGKTDGYAVSAVHRDPILPFALFQFPRRWLLASAPSCLLFSSRDGIRISSHVSIRSIHGISFCSASALPSRENYLNSSLRLFYYIYRYDRACFCDRATSNGKVNKYISNKIILRCILFSRVLIFKYNTKTW